MLSPNVIIPFDGLHASIPAGFTRETSLDGKYPKATAAAVNPNVNGGNATHTHTSPNHSHIMDGHSHTGSTTSNQHEDAPNQNTDSSGSDLPNSNHNHTYTASAISGESVANQAVSYSAISNDPPYYEVIFIKPSTYKAIPPNGMVMRESTTRPGLSLHAGSAGKYLKGAATAGNAGATGGSSTNSHTISHTHSVDHGHTGTSNGPSAINKPGLAGGSNSLANTDGHTHPITLTTTNVTSAANSSIGSQAEVVEPAHKTLNGFVNAGASQLVTQPGDIALWLGTLAAIPPGWVLCDGANRSPDMRDKFLKLNSVAGASTAGGSNTHTHASQSHTHTLPSHTHSGSVAASTTFSGHRGRGGGTAHNYWTSNSATPHTLSSVSSDAGSLAAGNTTADSSDNQPAFTTVAYIMFKNEPFGGAMMGLL